MSDDCRISVVTPTLGRPDQVSELLENLAGLTIPPNEVVIVDANPADNPATRNVVESMAGRMPFAVRWIQSERGTAVQRNLGIERASGRFIAFIDDDIRLEADFFARALAAFDDQTDAATNSQFDNSQFPMGQGVGGVVGYRTTDHFEQFKAERWRWYRRLRLLSTFEPGRYDFRCGYPINANACPPFSGTREVDFMTTSCAVWRREVFESGLRFDPFFSDYGVLEDAHMSLMAGRKWKLLQCGDARCRHLHTTAGRVNRRRLGYKYVVNYLYVFHQAAGPLSLGQRARFWRYQTFEMLRILASSVRRRRMSDLDEVLGRMQGFAAVATGRWNRR